MQLMSIEDLAAYLGDSKRTIYKYIASGDCPPYMKISTKNIKFDRADVDAWLESKKVFPVLGGKQMTDLKMIDSTKDLIKNAVRRGKLPWMPRAKAVLQQAEKQARKDGFELIGTEHILLGILSVKECLGAAILTNLGVTSTKCQRLYNQLCQPSSQKVTIKAKFSEDIEKVVVCTYEQADGWSHTYIGTEHLLVGMLKAHAGKGFQILNTLGITFEKVCDEAARLIIIRNAQIERKEE